ANSPSPITTTLEFGGGVHRLTRSSRVASAGAGAGAVLFTGGRTELAGTLDLSAGTTGLVVTGGSVGVPGVVDGFGSSLRVSGGTADFADHFVRVATVTIEGGTVRGVGALIPTGSMTWTTIGPLSSTVADAIALADGATLLINGQAQKVLDGADLEIPNSGSATWTGTGDLMLADGARIFNQGTFNVNNNRSILNSGATGSFVNGGTGLCRKDQSTDPTTVNVRYFNDGQVEVRTGTLQLLAGGRSSGRFIVTAGANPPAALVFGGSHRLTDMASVTGGGAGPLAVMFAAG